MTSSLARRASSSLALVAALAFALQPSLALAQSELGTPVKTGAKAPSKAKPTAKKASKHMPSDTVSDDLNRREAERAAQLVKQMMAASPLGAAAAAAPEAAPAVPVDAPTAVPAAATAAAPVPPAAPPAKAVASKPDSSLPPTMAAIPPRAPIVRAALTPDAGPQPGAPLSGPVRPPLIQEVQAPAPVPIPPPAAGQRPPSAGPAGAPSRAFGQSQVVPPQQPTLSLEVNKGTAIKLPGPAATVFVAAPDIADVQVKSPGMIYVFAKKPGDTVLYAVDDQDRVLLNTIVSVSSPLSRVKGALDALHPGNGVTFENQGETIVLGGTVRAAVVAEDARRLALQHVSAPNKVVNNIRVEAPTQVQLRVKVAEVRRDSLKRIGVNMQNIGNIAMIGVGAGTAGFASRTIQAVGGNATGAIAFRSNDGSFSALIDLLATQGQATILAEPNLVAMSGETASFLAGGEIPVISPQASSLTPTITVTYKQVGVSLAFTPTIIGERINLKVAPEVSQVTTEGQVSVSVGLNASIIIPAIQTRRASTTVELGSGQSFAIAGLMIHTAAQTINKQPWLGDLPVLGALFKSDAYQRAESELVIVVTPYFVEPTSGRLRTPLSNRVPPTDADRLVYQRFDHPTPPNRIAVGREQKYVGPSAGFKLD